MRIYLDNLKVGGGEEGGGNRNRRERTANLSFSSDSVRREIIKLFFLKTRRIKRRKLENFFCLRMQNFVDFAFHLFALRYQKKMPQENLKYGCKHIKKSDRRDFLMKVKEPNHVFLPYGWRATQFYCCWCEKLGQLSRWIMREVLNRNRRRKKNPKLLWLLDPFRRLCVLYCVPSSCTRTFTFLCATLDALNSIVICTSRYGR